MGAYAGYASRRAFTSPQPQAPREAHAPGYRERMPSTLDVSTLRERPAAGRLTRALEAHHDNGTFASLAPPYVGIGEPRTGWEGYHAVH